MPGGGSEAVILPALMGSAEAAALPPFLGAAVDAAAVGGIGSMLMGQDPLKGALLGGLTGGALNAMAPQGLGSLFGGGVNPSTQETAGALSQGTQGFIDKAAASNPGMYENASLSQALLKADPSLGTAAQQAASSPSGLSKFLPYAALTGGALALDKMMAPDSVGPALKEEKMSRPVAGLNRTQKDVDPNSYFTSGGNRSFYDPYSMAPQYFSHGGKVARFADGGSSSASSSNIPMGLGRYVKGKGDGMNDKIPAMLSDGEFVFSAPAVSAIGNGSNDAGAKKLASMQKGVLKKHYGGKPKKSQGLGAYA